MNQVEILTDALALIRNGWIKELYTDYVSCFCAAGAIYQVDSGNACGEYISEVGKSAIMKLARTISDLPVKTTLDAEAIITNWNDHPDRTKFDVIDMFIAAGAIE